MKPPPSRAQPTSDADRLAAARHAVAPVIVAAAALVVYANTAGNGFVRDDAVFTRDVRTRSLANAPAIFSDSYWGSDEDRTLYRPLSVYSLAINYAISGAHPFGYHVTNIAVHALNSVLVWWLATWAMGAGMGALAAGLLFAVHPIHVESVAAVVGRCELLAAMFVLLAMWAYFRNPPASCWSLQQHLLPAALLLLGMLCKEEATTAVVLMPIAGLCRARWQATDHERLGGTIRRWWGREWRLLTALVAAAGAYLALRTLVLGRPYAMPRSSAAIVDNFLTLQPWPERLASALEVLGRYGWLLIWPRTLSCEWGYADLVPANTLLGPWPLCGLALLVVSGIVAVQSLRGRARWLLPMAAFLIPYSLVSNLVIVIGVGMAERLLYLPSVGVALGAGMGLAALHRAASRALSRPATWLTPIVLSACCLALGARTVIRNRDWRDDASLWAATYRACPEDVKAQVQYAQQLRLQGHHAEAIALLERARDHVPTYSMIQHNLATAYADAGRYGQALAAVDEELRLKDTAEGRTNRGTILYHLRRYPEAEAAFRAALQRPHAGARAHAGLAATLARLGQIQQAIAAYGDAIERAPQNPDYYRRRGNLLVQAKRYQAALQDYARSEALAPNEPAAYVGAANAHLLLGQRREAVAVLQRGLMRVPPPARPAIQGALEKLRAATSRPDQ